MSWFCPNTRLWPWLTWTGLVFLAAVSLGADVSLIAPGAIWKYRDDGTNLNTAWRNLSYNDSAWPAGAAQLGYGDGDEVTTVGSGPDPDARFITTYFRHTFSVTNAGKATGLTLQLLRDDGAVVYLNGTELTRDNMPAGTINYLTLATTNAGSPDEDLFFSTNRPATLLRNGQNVLAVEVHQSSPASTDLGFDLALSYTLSDALNLAPQVTLLAPSNNTSWFAPAVITLEAAASDPDGSVARVSFLADGALLGVIANSPYRYLWTAFDAGQFALTAVVTDDRGSNVSSAPLRIAVLADDPFPLVRPGTVWKYLDTGQTPNTLWRSVGFNDSAWRSGTARLGYGGDGEKTVVRFGSDPADRFITTYFRRTFYVVDPTPFSLLSFRLLRDDGGVVFLNGREIFRSNMPEGAITATTLAESSTDDRDEDTFFPFSTDSTALVAGTNVLAVEIHQRTKASADLAFDLELLAFTDASNGTLMRGPYLQSATTNSVVVRWRTETSFPGRVFFGLDPGSLASYVDEPASVTEHIVKIGGLGPDSQYFYALGSTNTTAAVGRSNFFFRTLPIPGVARPVRIWALGDSGTANQNARRVRDAFLKLGPTNRLDVWLMLGDNAYDSGKDLDYQAAVFNLYPTILRQAVLWPTIGNHDSAFSETATDFPYLDIFSLPMEGEAGGVASGTEKYYSFDYANIHFVCLDSMTSSREATGPMLTWLADDLAATLQEWIIAFWHHPPYTKGSHDSDLESSLIQIRTNALPILEAGGVDLVLCGHSHAYERSYFLSDHYGPSSSLTTQMIVKTGDGRESGDGAYVKGGFQPNRGTVYVVAGSSGQVSGGPLNHPAMFVSLNQLGSLLVDVNGSRLDARFLRDNGTIDDTFTIRKADPGLEPLLSIAMDHAGPRLQWRTLPGRHYRVQRANVLDPPAWTDLGEVLVAPGNVLSYLDPAPHTETRFYRVIILP